MKKTSLLLTSLAALAVALSFEATGHAQISYYWNNPVDGNLDQAAQWTPTGIPGVDDHLRLAANGSYSVGLSGDLSARSLQFEGAGGTVTVALGTRSLTLSSVFLVNQNADITSGNITGTLQVGLGKSAKSVSLSGAQTIFTNNSGGFLGQSSTTAGSDNSLTLSDQAKLNITGSFTIGNANTDTATASDRNTLTVTGAGTVMTSGSLLVGNLNSGMTGASSKDNKLVVTSGAKVDTGSLQIGRRVGGVTLTTASGNRATVGGGIGASSLNMTGAVTIGNASGQNVLSVLENGTVTAGGTTTLNSGAGNALSIDGGSYLAGSQLVLVYGASTSSNSGLLEVKNGGHFQAGKLDLRGTLEASGASTLEVKSLTMLGTSKIHISLSSAADPTPIVITDLLNSITFNGTFQLTFEDGFEAAFGEEYQLFSFTEGSGTFTSFSLPELNGGLIWDTSRFYQDGTLAVIPEPGVATLSTLMLLGAALHHCRSRKKTTLS